MTYEEQLLALALSDERIVVMTAENRAAIRNLPEKLGDRFIDVGIAEMTMVGAAAGLALRGRKPIIHALGTFLTLRAFEFIRNDVGIAQLPVIIVGGVPGFLSEANGPTHQAIEDISLMRGIPGINVFCPSDAEELVEALPDLFASNAPWYIRYYAGAPVREHVKQFEIGKAEVYRASSHAEEVDVTILTYGFLLGEALQAQEMLQAGGMKVNVVNLRTLVPIDEEALLQSAMRSQLVVTLEDHFKIGGLYSIAAEFFLREGLLPEVLPIALDGKWFKPTLLKDLLKHEGFTGPQIAEKIRQRFTEMQANAESNLGEYLSLN